LSLLHPSYRRHPYAGLALLVLVACSGKSPAAEGAITLRPSGQRFAPAGVDQLRQALAQAKCGETVEIEAGTVIRLVRQQIRISHRCPVGRELVISGSKPERLPDAKSRITPGYLPLMPQFLVEDTEPNQPPFLLDSTQPAPSGIKFVGVALVSRVAKGREPYTLFQIGSTAAHGIEELPSNITFDRVYFTGDLDPAKRLVMGFYIVVSGITITNSFFDDFHRGPYEEGYVAYIANEAPGPFVFRNNYFGSGAAIPILAGGGGGPAFTKGQPHPTGFTVEHNYFYNSLKFYPGTPGYVGDANRPCLKNFFELKQGSEAVIRWNAGENSFNGCGGQGNGFVFTVRNIGWKQGGRAVLASDRRTVTITGYRSGSGLRPPQAGYALGVGRSAGTIPVQPAADQYEWRTIQSATGSGENWTLAVDSAFSPEAVTPADWALMAVPWGRISNVLVEGNYLRNTPNALLTLGVDDLHYGGGLKGLVYRGNLMVNDSPYFRYIAGKQEWMQGHIKVVNAGEDIEIAHNSFFVLPTIHEDGRKPRYAVMQEQGPPENRNITRGLRLYGNVMPWGEYGIVSSGVTPEKLWNERNDGGLRFQNNLFYQLPAGPDWKSVLETCQKPRVCRGNFLLTDASVAEGGFQIPRYKADDKANVGADLEKVPLMKLQVEEQSKALTFRYQLPAVLAEQSCSLEVSGDAGLMDDTAAYRLVDAVRPEVKPQADSDQHNEHAERSADGRVRKFPVNGLAGDREYYYRLMCGGAVERGRVKTKP
jgi:hypothetical protein